MKAVSTQYLPSYTVGTQAYDAVAQVVGAFGRKALLVGGSKALKAGAPKLEEALKDTPIELCGQLVYGTECTHENARRIAQAPEAQEAQMLFAMGGGRAIDCCKEAAELLGIPLFTFPTVASNCAPVTAIGVFYGDDGHADGYFFPSAPPVHTFIDLQVIADSPDLYFWAGIGDALSKEPEVELASRSQALAPVPAMGRALAEACGEPLFAYGKDALADKHRHRTSDAFEAVVLDIIVTCGLVSNLTTGMLEPEPYYYNSSVAHGFYNAWTGISPELVEAHPHGAVVAFGNLVLMAFDGRHQDLERFFQFNREMGFPVTLEEIGAAGADLDALVARAQSTTEWGKAPYPFTPERFKQAILDADFYSRAVLAGDELGEEVARLRMDTHAAQL